MRPWSEPALLATLWLSCTAAAVSRARSANVYLDSAARQQLGLTEGSIVPLWRVWERITQVFPGQVIPCLGPPVAAFLARLQALSALTKAALATLLQTTWGEQLDPDDHSKTELVMKVLAHEGIWVDLATWRA